jgi:hypothetical protein
MNSVNKCSICDEIFDLSDYERYENHLLCEHSDIMDIVIRLDDCEDSEKDELLMGLVRKGYGEKQLPDRWKGKGGLKDIYELYGWEAVFLVGKAIRQEELYVEEMKDRNINADNKV